MKSRWALAQRQPIFRLAAGLSAPAKTNGGETGIKERGYAAGEYPI